MTAKSWAWILGIAAVVGIIIASYFIIQNKKNKSKLAAAGLSPAPKATEEKKTTSQPVAVSPVVADAVATAEATKSVRTAQRYSTPN